MRIEYLREFVVLARHLNMRSASEELHITQSTLSKHLADLERQTKLHLADRGAFGVALTDAGMTFATESSFVVASYDAMIKRCQSIQQAHMRTLKIQELLQNSAMATLFHLAREYQDIRPDLSISFMTMSSGDAMTNLAKNKDLDIAIEVQYEGATRQIESIRSKGYAIAEIGKENVLCWYMKDNGRVPRNRKITFDDLVDMPIVTSAGEIFDYFGFALRCLFNERDATPLFRIVPMVNTPTDYFLQDFGTSVLLTSQSMQNDVRLSTRDDLSVAQLDESDMRIVFYAVCRSGDADAVGLLSHISDSITS